MENKDRGCLRMFKDVWNDLENIVLQIDNTEVKVKGIFQTEMGQ